MSWLALLLVPLGLYLAYKVAGFVMKTLLIAALLVAGYWWAAPRMGWPTVSDVFYVLGPDFGGQRIEEVADPSRLAKQATDEVVEKVIDRSGIRQLAPPARIQPDAAPGGQAPAPASDPPQPL